MNSTSYSLLLFWLFGFWLSGHTYAATDRPSIPLDSIPVIANDVSSAPVADTVYWRYVWLSDPEAAPDIQHALNYGLNHSHSPVKSQLLAGGRVIRVDLLDYIDTHEQLKTLVDSWERLTQDEGYFLTDQFVTRVLGRFVGRHTKSNGNVSFGRFREEEVRRFHPAFDRLADSVVRARTGSAVPIVRGDWLIHRLLANTAGGLYYEFRGIREYEGDDLVGYLKDRGIFGRAYEKYATTRSEVTGRARQVLFFTGGGRVVAYVTLDPSIEQTRDPRNNPSLTLEGAEVAATEVIWVTPWGGHEFTLFAFNEDRGEFDLVRTADENVVSDRSGIPRPHPTTLEPALSCIRCHSQGNGLQPLGDRFSVAARISEQAARFGVNKIEAQYTGNPQRFIEDGIDILRNTTRIITKDETRDSWRRMVSHHDDYHYEMVTPRQACVELGFAVDNDEHGRRLIKEIVGTGQLEDPRIQDLRRGPIQRSDFRAIYQHLSLRAMLSVAARERSKF